MGAQVVSQLPPQRDDDGHNQVRERGQDSHLWGKGQSDTEKKKSTKTRQIDVKVSVSNPILLARTSDSSGNNSLTGISSHQCTLELVYT